MSPPTDHINGSPTWMLFESGNGVVVDLAFYAPPRKTTRPIDAWLVTGDEGVFKDSARRAAVAVYDAVHPKGAGSEPLVVGFDLGGLPGGRPVTGESGGLAFAVALAKRLLQKDPGPVAATGVVKSGHGGGPIGPVQGIEAKLRAAGRLVPENGWVLYPEENDPDIPETLRRSLKESGLKLQPVSSVAEALMLLFEPSKPQHDKTAVRQGKPRPLVRRSLVVALICAALLLLLQIHNWPPFGQDKSMEQPDSVPSEAPLTAIERQTGPKEDATKAEIRKTGLVKDESKKESVKETIEAKDLPKEELPKDKVTVTEDQTAEASGKKPLDSKPSAPVSQAPPDITLRGQTATASRLARLTSQELEDLFNQGTYAYNKPLRITGRVVILGITERPGENPGDLKTEITVAARGLTCADGTVSRALPDIQVTARGRGLATALLPAAGSDLAEEIQRVMKRKAPEGAESIQKPKKSGRPEEAPGKEIDRGFE